MVLLRGDWRADYAGRPPIFDTGTVGQMVHVDELPDGRFNIVLRGLATFVVRDEVRPPQAYREAHVTWREDREERIASGAREHVVEPVHRYLERLGRKPTSPGALDRDVDDATFVNFFGQHLDLDPLERQALLQEASTSSRAARLVDVLEFRLQETTRIGQGAPGRTH
jgi:Lon protease-like protein